MPGSSPRLAAKLGQTRKPYARAVNGFEIIRYFVQEWRDTRMQPSPPVRGQGQVPKRRQRPPPPDANATGARETSQLPQPEKAYAKQPPPHGHDPRPAASWGAKIGR